MMGEFKVYSQIADRLQDVRRMVDAADRLDQASPCVEGRLDAIQKLGEAVGELAHVVEMLAERVKRIDARN